MKHRRFGPKSADHPSVGRECPACQQPMRVGEFTTVLPLGPGADADARRCARAGLPYNAVALELHWSCATGKRDDED